jgi:hypothetical protein
MDEIFQKKNFVAQFVWNTEGHTDNQFHVKINHEYVVCYAKNTSAVTFGHVIDPNTREESNLWAGFAENSITKNGSEVFAALQTQWRSGMSGPTGLDYTALEPVMRLQGIKKRDRQEVFAGVRVMEIAALEVMRAK